MAMSNIQGATAHPGSFLDLNSNEKAVWAPSPCTKHLHFTNRGCSSGPKDCSSANQMAVTSATSSKPCKVDVPNVEESVEPFRCPRVFVGHDLSESASGADLGGSSKYSNENFED